MNGFGPHVEDEEIRYLDDEPSDEIDVDDFDTPSDMKDELLQNIDVEISLTNMKLDRIIQLLENMQPVDAKVSL